MTLGRFYSNDPVGFTASNPMMFNRYAYGNNNPYRYVDPDGAYARGSGWSDEDWERFSEAQDMLADKMESTATTLTGLASNLGEGETSAGGYSSSDLTQMAEMLNQAVAALRDNESYVINVESMEDSGIFGVADNPGKNVTLNSNNGWFGNMNHMRFQHGLGHEALHNVGARHNIHQGFMPYRFGSFNSRQSFKHLSRDARAAHPDYIMKKVFP